MKNKLFNMDGKLYKIYWTFGETAWCKELKTNTMRPKMYSNYIYFNVNSIKHLTNEKAK